MKLWLIVMFIIGILGMSCSASAADYLVWQFTEQVRVVLSPTPGKCKTGNQASAQSIDGRFIPGCWTYESNPELIRIVWHNGDFSVLRIRDFTPVKE